MTDLDNHHVNDVFCPVSYTEITLALADLKLMLSGSSNRNCASYGLQQSQATVVVDAFSSRASGPP